ncbi:MAG: InlB B-repeat-containing protein [Clostridia bacterium]|nr:InlB B-repeat-containing protein [Clostridia bacterium]
MLKIKNLIWIALISFALSSVLVFGGILTNKQSPPYTNTNAESTVFKYGIGSSPAWAYFNALIVNYDNTYANITDASFSKVVSATDESYYYHYFDSLTIELTDGYVWKTNTFTIVCDNQLYCKNNSVDTFTFTRSDNVWSTVDDDYVFSIGSHTGSINNFQPLLSVDSVYAAGEENTSGLKEYYLTINLDLSSLVVQMGNGTVYENQFDDATTNFYNTLQVTYDSTYGTLTSSDISLTETSTYKYYYFNSFTFELNSLYRWKESTYSVSYLNSLYPTYASTTGGTNLTGTFSFTRTNNVWANNNASEAILSKSTSGQHTGGADKFLPLLGFFDIYTPVYAGNSYILSFTFDVASLVELSSCTVSFNSNGGSSCASITVDGNTAYGTLPTPVRSGFAFGGWYKNSDFSGSPVTASDIVTENHTLYAKWRAYEVTFVTPNSGAEITKQVIDTREAISSFAFVFASGKYISTIQLNSGEVIDIKAQLGSISGADYCTSVRYTANKTGSEILIEALNLKADLTITLGFVSTERNLKESGASVEGIAVKCTKGGIAYYIADDFENLADTDTITFVTKQILQGYTFSHWIDLDGNNLGSDMSIRLTKAQVMDNVITAIYVQSANNSVNNETNN